MNNIIDMIIKNYKFFHITVHLTALFKYIFILFYISHITMSSLAPFLEYILNDFMLILFRRDIHITWFFTSNI